MTWPMIMVEGGYEQNFGGMPDGLTVGVSVALRELRSRRRRSDGGLSAPRTPRAQCMRAATVEVHHPRMRPLRVAFGGAMQDPETDNPSPFWTVPVPVN